MKNLKNIIVSCIGLAVLSSCVVGPTTPRYEEIPKGPHCLVLRNGGFCIDDRTGKEYKKSFKGMRGWEAVPFGYKEELELFMYDILEENEKLRIECGEE